MLPSPPYMWTKHAKSEKHARNGRKRFIITCARMHYIMTLLTRHHYYGTRLGRYTHHHQGPTVRSPKKRRYTLRESSGWRAEISPSEDRPGVFSKEERRSLLSLFKKHSWAQVVILDAFSTRRISYDAVLLHSHLSLTGATFVVLPWPCVVFINLSAVCSGHLTLGRNAKDYRARGVRVAFASCYSCGLNGVLDYGATTGIMGQRYTRRTLHVESNTYAQRDDHRAAASRRNMIHEDRGPYVPSLSLL